MSARLPDHDGVLARRSRPLVFAADFDTLDLDEADHHHLARVLRVADGSEITVGDGSGRWRWARFGSVLEPVGEVHTENRPPTELTVAFTPVKGERSEWTVQKLTELGIDRIIPLETERSVVRWNDHRAAKQHARWERVAREASQQSRRVWLPRIDPVTAFGALTGASEAGRQLTLAEPGGRSLAPRDHMVCIGPEGGWSDGERTEVDPEQLVSLPGGILRAETASLAAAVIMVSHRTASARSQK